jgi:hypothetical protein
MSLMGLSEDKEDQRVGGMGQAPVAPSVLLTLLIYA